MYETETETKTFDTEDRSDMEEYSAIVNNPMCSIIDTIKEKLTDCEYDEGKLSSTSQKVVLVVTWQTKVLL